MKVAEKKLPVNQYETLYVLRPDLDEQDSCGVMKKMKEWIAQRGGKSIQVLCWGRKKLAWPRDDLRKGLFVQHKYAVLSDAVSAYERELDLNEHVLLRQTLVLDRNVDLAAQKELVDEFIPKKEPSSEEAAAKQSHSPTADSTASAKREKTTDSKQESI